MKETVILAFAVLFSIAVSSCSNINADKPDELIIETTESNIYPYKQYIDLSEYDEDEEDEKDIESICDCGGIISFLENLYATHGINEHESIDSVKFYYEGIYLTNARKLTRHPVNMTVGDYLAITFVNNSEFPVLVGNSFSLQTLDEEKGWVRPFAHDACFFDFAVSLVGIVVLPFNQYCVAINLRGYLPLEHERLYRVVYDVSILPYSGALNEIEVRLGYEFIWSE